MGLCCFVVQLGWYLCDASTCKEMHLRMHSTEIMPFVRCYPRTPSLKVIALTNGNCEHGNHFTRLIASMSLMDIQTCHPLTGRSRKKWKLWRDGIPWLSCKALHPSMNPNLNIMYITVLCCCGRYLNATLRSNCIHIMLYRDPEDFRGHQDLRDWKDIEWVLPWWNTYRHLNVL